MTSIKVNLDLWEKKFGEFVKIWLFNSAQAIRAQAQENAPYDTGKLKQSIWIHPSSITTNTRVVAIGPRNVPYAEIREYINYKNPHKRLYMSRARESAKEIVDREFKEAFNIIYNK